jgi:hypothetical protein
VEIGPVKRIANLDYRLTLEKKMVVDLILIEKNCIRRLEGKIREYIEFDGIDQLMAESGVC